HAGGLGLELEQLLADQVGGHEAAQQQRLLRRQRVQVRAAGARHQAGERVDLALADGDRSYRDRDRVRRRRGLRLGGRGRRGRGRGLGGFRGGLERLGGREREGREDEGGGRKGKLHGGSFGDGRRREITNYEWENYELRKEAGEPLAGEGEARGRTSLGSSPLFSRALRLSHQNSGS